MLYRYETHCHGNLCSACAHSRPSELVHAYHNAGYAGMVLTDHFIHGNTAVDTHLPWEVQMRHYYAAYEEAAAAAKGLDFDVIFGLEHAFGGGQEALVYGIDLDFLLAHPDMSRYCLTEFADAVHTYGGILILAHPYRYGGWEISIPTCILDGIEVYNAGNPPVKNKMAFKTATSFDAIMTSGGDTHWIGAVTPNRAGITLPYRVRNGAELVAALKNRDHGWLAGGRVIDVLTEDSL